MTRRFGDRVAVDHVSFHIERSETYGLLGPNGAGKTTTISIIAGVLASDAGSVTVAGQPVTVKAGAAKRTIGLVPQDIALHLDLSGRENLRFFGRLQQMPTADLSRRMADVLDIVGLADRADDRVSLGVDLAAADVVSELSGAGFDTAFATVSADQASVMVEVSDVGAISSAQLNDFSRTAPQNLVLFVFINSLAGGAFLVRTRASGTLRRALSTRSGIGTQLLGLGLGWYRVALLQSVLIVVVGRVFFDVHWGQTLPATVLVLVFAAVGAGAGLLVGAVGDNEDRVGAMAPIVGLVLGALAVALIGSAMFLMRRRLESA